MSTIQEFVRHCEIVAGNVFAGAKPALAADVATYLAHVSGGLTMRAIAKVQGRQPSTVMRAIRRVEALRDDPLVENAISALETDETFSASAPCNEVVPMKSSAPARVKSRVKPLSASEKVALQRLAEPEAFLLVAKGAEKAGVFCAKNGFRKPLSLLPVATATRFLTEDWLKRLSQSEHATRYVMTAAGRSMLRRLAAHNEAAPGMAEAPAVFAGQHQLASERRVVNVETGDIETVKVNLGESPLGWLARRKDANGACLLSPEEVEAGERLREDYEMAQIGPKMGQDWQRFLAPVDRRSGPGRSPSEGPLFARERFAKAAEALGPGLSDAAIRICCFHEGLEATERRMGWSARSGKVVLKLALQRLVDHYGLLRYAA